MQTSKKENFDANVGSENIHVSCEWFHATCGWFVVMHVMAICCCFVGLFCMHLVKVFTHLQIKKIPSKYILKRYTRNARSYVEWNRNDMVKGGHGENQEQMRFAKLIPVVMGIARAGNKSAYAYEEALNRATELRALIETILANVTRASAQQGKIEDVGDAYEESLTLVAPPMSQTKRCGPGTVKYSNMGVVHDQVTSTYKQKCGSDGQEIIGERSCGICKLKGHYSTTCPRNPNRNHATKKKVPSRGGVRKRGRPHTKRCSSEESREELICEDNDSTEDG
jgi:hypothetical protein